MSTETRTLWSLLRATAATVALIVSIGAALGAGVHLRDLLLAEIPIVDLRL